MKIVFLVSASSIPPEVQEFHYGCDLCSWIHQTEKEAEARVKRIIDANGGQFKMYEEGNVKSWISDADNYLVTVESQFLLE